MIDRTQAISICEQTVLTDIEQLKVIRKFIFDKKGVDVGEIERPNNVAQLYIMEMAFTACCNYYLKN